MGWDIYTVYNDVFAIYENHFGCEDFLSSILIHFAADNCENWEFEAYQFGIIFWDIFKLENSDKWNLDFMFSVFISQFNSLHLISSNS